MKILAVKGLMGNNINLPLKISKVADIFTSLGRRFHKRENIKLKDCIPNFTNIFVDGRESCSPTHQNHVPTS